MRKRRDSVRPARFPFMLFRRVASSQPLQHKKANNRVEWCGSRGPEGSTVSNICHIDEFIEIDELSWICLQLSFMVKCYQIHFQKSTK